MPELRDVLEDLRGSVDEIIAHWEGRVAARPWMSLPEDARIDHLPGLVEGLMSAMLGDPTPEEARRRAVEMAVRHGEHRREHGFQDGILHREHHLLRSSIWDIIQERYGSRPACLEAISMIDVATTMTTTASLHGYHLPEGDESEEELVARLSREGPWPDPV